MNDYGTITFVLYLAVILKSVMMKVSLTREPKAASPRQLLLLNSFAWSSQLKENRMVRGMGDRIDMQ